MYSFFLDISSATRSPHSFPTRRSSDLSADACTLAPAASGATSRLRRRRTRAALARPRGPHMTTPRPAATTRESAFVVPPPASPTDGVPRTLIVSDVRLYREGLAVTLGAREELRIVGTADDVAAARRCIAARAPDVVLLDTGMRD